MASITQKQIASANAKLKNGFVFDTFYYLTHGEKTARKRIPINDGTNAVACLHLMYHEEYDHSKGLARPTGRHIPCVHLSKEFPDGNFYHSFGLGRWMKVGEPQPKRMFSVLQKLSGELDEDLLVRVCKGEPNTIEESKPLFL